MGLFERGMALIMAILGIILMYKEEPIASGCFWIASAVFHLSLIITEKGANKK